jgi:hypothetical protein
VPLCQGGESTWDVRGEGMLEVVCPGVRQRNASVAAATGRKWRRSSCRAHNSNLQLPECGPVGRHDRVSQAVCNNEPNRSQQSNQDCTLKPLWMRPTSGRAKTTSVIDAITRRAARWDSLPVLILTIPNNPFRHSCTLSDYNCGATLIRARTCVHVFFHRICNLAGPMETPLCKISF